MPDVDRVKNRHEEEAFDMYLLGHPLAGNAGDRAREKRLKRASIFAERKVAEYVEKHGTEND